MVEMRGFEPLTPWMQTRCSAGLSYIPATPILRTRLPQSPSLRPAG